MHISVYLFIFANRIITITPKSRKGNKNMNLYFFTKKNVYQITKNDDGTVTFYPEDKNAGNMIAQRGGVESFLTCCKEDARSYEEVLAERQQEQQAEKERKKAASQQRKEAEEEAAMKAYNELLVSYGMDINHIDKSVVIDATAKNLYIIMRYMQITNWGIWKLPRLSQGYAANQYDCDGKIAVTVILNDGITTEDGKVVKKLQYGVPMGHLSNYTNIGRL